MHKVGKIQPRQHWRKCHVDGEERQRQPLNLLLKCSRALKKKPWHFKTLAVRKAAWAVLQERLADCEAWETGCPPDRCLIKLASEAATMKNHSGLHWAACFPAVHVCILLPEESLSGGPSAAFFVVAPATQEVRQATSLP